MDHIIMLNTQLCSESLSVQRSYLLQFGESQGVAVLSSELHEPHVGWVCELSNDAETGKQPE